MLEGGLERMTHVIASGKGDAVGESLQFTPIHVPMDSVQTGKAWRKGREEKE